MRRMAASVLVFEAFIALFFGLVVAKLHPSGDWIVAVALGVVSVLLSGLMRYRWAYAAGWVLQAGFVAAGFLVTDMFVLGIVFAAIWWTGLHFGAKAEEIRAERMEAARVAAERVDEGLVEQGRVEQERIASAG
jgi:hypothetical protein